MLAWGLHPSWNLRHSLVQTSRKVESPSVFRRMSFPSLILALSRLSPKPQAALPSCKVRRRATRVDQCRLWEALSPSKAGPLKITSQLLDRAWKMSGFRDPDAIHGQRSLPLYRVVHAAFPELFPSASAAKKALKRGYVLVDGEAMPSSSLSPPLGSVLTAFVSRSLESPKNDRLKSIDQRLEMWNSGRPKSSKIYVLHNDENAAWAVVNKPSGLHTSPVGLNAWKSLTLQSYLPALIAPPTGAGTPCRNGPRPCHRLDFLVAGPVAVAASEEAMRSLNRSFKSRKVHKEYRAILCGSCGGPGESFSIHLPVEGKSSHTDVDILQVVPHEYYGSLTEVSLKPREGRRHQLRIHCAAIGMPIVNDVAPIYALAQEAWLQRWKQALPVQQRVGQGLFLQAVKLAVPHPFDSIEVSVEVEIAEKFRKVLHSENVKVRQMHLI